MSRGQVVKELLKDSLCCSLSLLRVYVLGILFSLVDQEEAA